MARFAVLVATDVCVCVCEQHTESVISKQGRVTQKHSMRSQVLESWEKAFKGILKRSSCEPQAMVAEIIFWLYGFYCCTCHPSA
jgi:hypothetical protein